MVCLCVDGTNPVCPVPHDRKVPEWLRRARSHSLPAYAVGGRAIPQPPNRMVVVERSPRSAGWPSDYVRVANGDYDLLADGRKEGGL